MKLPTCQTSSHAHPVCFCLTWKHSHADKEGPGTSDGYDICSMDLGAFIAQPLCQCSGQGLQFFQSTERLHQTIFLSRCKSAEAHCRSMDEQLHAVQEQAAMLQEALEVEKAAAAADAASLRHRLEQEAQQACSRAEKVAEAQAENRMAEQTQRFEALLAEKDAVLTAAAAEAERLKAAFAEATSASEALDQSSRRAQELERCSISGRADSLNRLSK